MKKLLIFIVLIVFGYNSYSQNMHGLSYSMSLPVGETSDLISKYQWRGLAIEGKYFVADQVTIGWQSGWNTMYEGESGTFTDGTRTRTGTQYNWLNIWPMLLTFDYFFGTDGDTQPYLGAGVGTYWVEQRSQMGLFSDTYSTWNFGIAPEVGVLIPINLYSNFYVNLKYNYGLNGSADVSNYSWLSFNVGFLWY
jgi:opacity protein-like surface antigen